MYTLVAENAITLLIKSKPSGYWNGTIEILKLCDVK